MIKIQKTKCDQCLFTKNRIVTLERAKEAVKDILDNDSYFCCHKSMDNNDVCCRGFWDAHKNDFSLGRLLQHLHIIIFIDLP